MFTTVVVPEESFPPSQSHYETEVKTGRMISRNLESTNTPFDIFHAASLDSVRF